MAVDPKEIMALRDRYLDQATSFLIKAQEHDQLAARAIKPESRAQHERAAASYRADWRTVQDLAQRQHGALEAAFPDAIKPPGQPVAPFDPDRDQRREWHTEASWEARRTWDTLSHERDAQDRELDRER